MPNLEDVRRLRVDESVILADASIWIEFFRSRMPALRRLLENKQIVMHPCLVAELALGSLQDRELTLAKLGQHADAATR